ncbi:hypothetical protein [Streptomyces sp. N50]|uniref:hypothetical protein n=1 Tax=Streptomyces sp. N50 TaxID=3081765 RepID=UPI00296255D1|nr:hypothetical protein [Streptomyces sp. N50]WOX14107.1 hypothetical protein R2B38_37070 [Streptomyces sp. N50]
MTDLRYTPTFKPTDWIDNVSRITADGPNGFNVRFDAIASDLHQAAAVVTGIDTALAQPVGTPTGQQLLTPGLDLVSLPGGDGWLYDETGAAFPSVGGSDSVAVMGLSLPADIRLVSFRAVGLWSGAPAGFSIALTRALLANASAAPDKLAEIGTTTSAITNPYDITVPVDASFAAVDLQTYRYCVVARGSAIQQAGGTSLSTVQLAYTAS